MQLSRYLLQNLQYPLCHLCIIGGGAKPLYSNSFLSDYLQLETQHFQHIALLIV